VVKSSQVKVKSSDFTLDLTHGKQVISTQKGKTSLSVRTAHAKSTHRQKLARAPAARCPQMKRHTAHSSVCRRHGHKPGPVLSCSEQRSGYG
jgi:hypothetical protein